LDIQQSTPEEDELNGNGNDDPLRNIHRTIEDVCKNANDNTLIATFKEPKPKLKILVGASSAIGG
jgi:hypothetical protein